MLDTNEDDNGLLYFCPESFPFRDESLRLNGLGFSADLLSNVFIPDNFDEEGGRFGVLLDNRADVLPDGGSFCSYKFIDFNGVLAFCEGFCVVSLLFTGDNKLSYFESVLDPYSLSATGIFLPEL